MLWLKKGGYDAVTMIAANLKGWVNSIMNSCVYETVMWRGREADPRMIEDILSFSGNVC